MKHDAKTQHPEINLVVRIYLPGHGKTLGVWDGTHWRCKGHVVEPLWWETMNRHFLREGEEGNGNDGDKPPNE